MRISLDENSPDFNVMWPYAEVTLDGVLIRGVTAADEEEGTLTAYMYGEDGRVLVEGDEVLQAVVEGRVKITFPTVQ